MKLMGETRSGTKSVRTVQGSHGLAGEGVGGVRNGVTGKAEAA